MTGSPLWREWESGNSIPLSVLRFCVLFVGLLFLALTGVLGLPWPQQALVALLTVVVAVWLDRSSSSYLVTLTLMLLSVYSTFRYGFWRVATTVGSLRDPGSKWMSVDVFFMTLLLLSECYAFVVLVLGYMQMVWPLRRMPVPLPDETYDWPAVDVLIPTLNEPLEVVRFTALAALNMDWPAEKLNVFILDDGHREAFREFAEEAGVGYMTRDDNSAAKAGNLNAALARTESPFVVVFDADHVPTRSFLQVTMGWFLRDAQLGILQTPHHFYSADPFGRNLGQHRDVPAEDELFYGLVQDGNDFWNATYFCGSCAVLRRRALDEAGGMATETVTEDAHTSMRMQRLGWNSAYINIPQAAGLATDKLSAHVRQRIRWARGMVQILRIESPLLGPGLKFAQRLCYFNAMSHFLYALPRLIFLTAPLMYLIFGYTNIPGYWAAILAYAVPHLVLSGVARSRMQGSHRHSFWTEIYETVLAPYLLVPTVVALLSPRRGRFNVTAKGETVGEEYFDSQIARPTLVLLAANWFGLCCAIPRLVQIPSWQVPAWASFVNWPATLYDPGHAGTIAINAGWTVFNLVLLGVAAAVAWESVQRRRSVRVETQVPSEVVLADGSKVRGITADLSSGGVRTRMEYDVEARPGDAVQFVFPVPNGTAVLPAIVVGLDGRVLRAKFDRLTLPELEALTMILYARADRWLGWSEAREADRPVRSFVRILGLAARGLRHAFFGGPALVEPEPPRRGWASVVPMIVLGLLLLGGERSAGGAQATEGEVTAPAERPLVERPLAEKALVEKPAVAKPAVVRGVHPLASAAAVGEFHSVVSLADVGVGETIALRGTEGRRVVPFALPQSVLVRAATLQLRYRFSAGLLPEVSRLTVSLNGTPVATLAVSAAQAPVLSREDAGVEQRPHAGSRLRLDRPGEQGPLLEAAIALPAELLARSNALTFEFAGHYATECEDPAHPALWSHVDTDSAIELTGTTIPLEDELGLLPMPFYQAGVSATPATPIVFLGTPSAKGMQAAGIVASWLGTLAGSRPMRFPVTVGRIPAGNAVVIAESGAAPASLGLGLPSGPTVAMRTNPGDPFAKVLVLTGANGDDLVKAAAVVALDRSRLQGKQVTLADWQMPARRMPDDAPRWMSTEAGHGGDFGSPADAVTLSGDGSEPATVYLRVPPDLFYDDGPGAVYGEGLKTLPLHLRYRYNGRALGDGSELQVWVNGDYAGSIAVPPTDRATTTAEAVLPVPVAMLRPFSNTFVMRWAFAGLKRGGCAVAGPAKFSGTILKESYLEVQGIEHWTSLPNLELFANAGYPFTRRADLAETAVVLPAEPAAEELELFLTMMGHFGAQTGYPVLRVSVAGPEGLTRDGRRDYLVLGTVEDQPALRELQGEMPVSVDEGGLHLREAGGFFGRSAWWKVGGERRGGLTEFETAGGMPDALVEGLEWPRGSRRSVVTIVLRDGAAAPGFLAAFARSAASSEIGQTVSALRGGRWTSYRMGGGEYMAGQLPAEERVKLMLAAFPWVIVLVAVIVCLLMGSLLRGILRRGARMRLQGSS